MVTVLKKKDVFVFFQCTPSLIDLQDEMLRPHDVGMSILTILRPDDTVPTWFFQLLLILGERLQGIIQGS